MRRRGFTLLEMMVVVAIVGLMSALAAGGVQQVITAGRVNGAASTLSRMLSNARMRAIGMSCRVSVQLNGPNYAPTGAPLGAPIRPATVSIFQKGNCTADATLGAFELAPAPPALADRVVASFSVADQRVTGTVSTAWLASGVLDNQSILVSWGVDSDGLFKRSLYVDSTGSGAFAPVVAPGDLSLTFTANGGPQHRAAILPETGSAYPEM